MVFQFVMEGRSSSRELNEGYQDKLFAKDFSCCKSGWSNRPRNKRALKSAFNNILETTVVSRRDHEPDFW